ncbi:hypothetical protein AVEN_174266-1 [Araneus ventricosus]|uniref:Mos1 transposase HTH domain-containing protein n=1 Tax=Araneus ventricosus TaxID=182803 RepID=A0A4Y2P1S0_ARAVE|nr:hypothetical protein AVEN_108640-1 [Araneus ventricosus]GBN44297.1 hypothetical protein AVEN_174266-1 [Araneus ventricosus]
MRGGRLLKSLTIAHRTTDVSLRFSVSCRHVNVASRIDAPAKYELRSVIRFLQAEGNCEAEIHRRMSRIYGENSMSDGIVRE